MTTYKVTRRFTAGILKGLTYTSYSLTPIAVGFECKNPIGGSGYVIVICEKLVN